MTNKLNEALKTAASDLRFVTKCYLSLNELKILTDRLVMTEKVMMLNPSVTRETCQKFHDDCEELHDRLVSDGHINMAYEVRRVACELFSDCNTWYRVARITDEIVRKGWTRNNGESECIARWESRGGKWWVELWRGRFDYYYRSVCFVGSVCSPFVTNDKAAIVMQAMLDCGRFLPDDAGIPMRRVT